MLLLMKYMKIMEESIDAATVYGKSKDSIAVGGEDSGKLKAGICRDRAYFSRTFKRRNGGCCKSPYGKRCRGDAAS